MIVSRWNRDDTHWEWLDADRYLVVENDVGDGGRVLDRSDDFAQPGPLSLLDAEEVADRFVSALELDVDRINDPLVIVAQTRARLTSWGRRACRATVTWEPCLTLRAPLGAPEPRLKKNLIHEFGHVAAEFAGIERPHDEDWIDEVGAAIWLRRKAVQRALRLWGWDGERLLRAFGVVPGEVVFRRVAHVGGGVAFYRSRVAPRRVFAPEHIEIPPRAAGWERRWMEVALRGGHIPTLWRDGAWSIDDPLEGRAGVILLSPTWLDSADWRLGNG